MKGYRQQSAQNTAAHMATGQQVLAAMTIDVAGTITIIVFIMV